MCFTPFNSSRVQGSMSAPYLELLTLNGFLIISRQNILRPKLHLLLQAVHRRIDHLELEVLHAVLDKFIDAPAHIVHGTEKVAVESERHAVDIALVAFTAGLQGRHGEIQAFVTGFRDGRQFFDGDGDLRGIAAIVPRGLSQDVAADLHFLRRKPTGYPTFAVFSSTFGGELHPAAHPNGRMGLLEWLWINFGAFELDEITFVGSKRLGPNRFHRFNIFIGTVAATFIRHAKDADLVALPGSFGTETDADQQTTIGEMIKRRILFRGVNRVPAGHDQTRYPENN